MSLSNRARIGKFLGPKGQKQIAQAKAAVAIANAVKPRPSVRSLDKRIKKINRNVELKHTDVLMSSTAIASTGVLTLLNALSQGTSDITRTGDDVSATSIQWRIRIDTDPDNLRDTVIRHLIVWDRQANGAVFTIASLLDNSVITSLINAPYNHSFQERFKILHDSVHVLKPSVLLDFDPASGTTSTNQSSSKYIRGKRQLSRMVKYDGNAGTIADIKTNSLYSVFVSDTGGTGADPTVLAGYRFYFKDM